VCEMLRSLIILSLVACVSATWSEWKEVNGECSDSCGMCGIRVIAERKCLTKNCIGPSQQTEFCGEKLCVFPRKTCCEGYVKGLTEGNTLECMPKQE
ncbi:hypothetical protein PMAYCL1PPCAC_10742, partial [Pristionchus mayeri]